MGFDVLSVMIPIFSAIIFIIVIGVFVMTAVKGVSQWNKNNDSPVLTAAARVMSKRTKVTSNMQTRTGDNFPLQVSKRTFCFVTFEVESGDRMEFQLNEREYSLLSEGDRGMLTFQGSRFKGFLRSADISFHSSVGSEDAASSQTADAPTHRVHSDDSSQQGESGPPDAEFFFSPGFSEEEKRGGPSQ